MVNSTTLNVTTPAGAGQVDVVLQHPGGNQTLTNAFTYHVQLATISVTGGNAQSATVNTTVSNPIIVQVRAWWTWCCSIRAALRR